MFYDESFIYDVLDYMRPEDPEKPEAERIEDAKLRKKIKALLDKKRLDPRQKLAVVVSAEDAHESFAAESFFDVMSPDRNLSDDDEQFDSVNNPFSLQLNEMEDVPEGENFDSQIGD